MTIRHSVNVDVNVNVNFQAFTDFVAYLKSNDQAKIDALTTKVGSLTATLKASNDNLSQAVADEQK